MPWSNTAPRWWTTDGIGAVDQLGIDETSFLAASRARATVYVTGLVDLEAEVVIDMVQRQRRR